MNIVIVDAYSAGNLLAPEFKRAGANCFHVQSTKEIWPVLLPTFRSGDFVENFALNENQAELVAWAKSKNPICVIPGTETGVELADWLSEQLELPNSNGTALSKARRNKYEMIETCRRAGLRVAAQCAASDWNEVETWLKGNAFPKYVVKPLESAGTDQVSICHTPGEVRRAFDSIIGTTNKLGLKNSQVLVQEFLEGTEYFLNSVSCAGRHHFTDIWRYQKRSIHDHDCVYDMNVLCPSQGETEKLLTSYVRQVLEALGVKYGPAHAEVMLGPKGPALVEIGTRLDGLSVVDFNRKAVGYSPVDLTVDCYLNPKEFQNKASRPYPLLFHARTVYLTSFQDGTVQEIPGEQALRNLRSFHQMRLRVKPGSPIVKTTNYFTAPGFMSLTHHDPKVLEEDYAFIRAFEKEQLFNVDSHDGSKHA